MNGQICRYCGEPIRPMWWGFDPSCHEYACIAAHMRFVVLVGLSRPWVML